MCILQNIFMMNPMILICIINVWILYKLSSQINKDGLAQNKAKNAYIFGTNVLYELDIIYSSPW